MRLRSMCLVICSAATLWSGSAVAQTADIEGHVFNKRSGVPIEGAVVVIYENVTLGPAPFLLGEDATDGNGFYQVRIATPTFPVGVIEVFCRTRRGEVLHGVSSAPLQGDVIRRRDVYLETQRRVRACVDPEPGDIPPFVRN
ncbi:MAG: hypothetical protein V3T64_04530 [Myxococcota bacterium]